MAKKKRKAKATKTRGKVRDLAARKGGMVKAGAIKSGRRKGGSDPCDGGE